MIQQPLTAMLIFVYILLMIPVQCVINSRLRSSKLVRKTLQNATIIMMTLLFFRIMTLLR
ncbi:MAG: hypothetical protein G5701_09065 [Serratia symbiotica]|nr:hypothetical protein [Serratia symbiotica]